MNLRLLPLFAVLLLTACSQDSDTPPSMPDASQLNDDETTMGNAFLAQGPNLLDSRDYDKLEQLEASDAALASPFASGTDPLFDFYHGLAFFPDDQADKYADRVDALSAWVAARPNSNVAHTALAACLFYQNGHGGGGSGDLLAQARSELDRVASGDRDAAWYEIMLEVLCESGADDSERDQVINESISRFPNYIETLRTALFYREPRWGGSNDASAAFAAQCADRVGGDEGDVLYARLAEHTWFNNYDEVLFTDRKFSWPRVKNGMTIICNRYPHSTMAMNVFFALASIAHQRQTALFLLDHMGDHYDPTAWPSRDYFDHFCGWVRNPCTPW